MAAHARADAVAVEWDTLTAALNGYGIRHVAPVAEPRGPLPTGSRLFHRLFASPQVRLQEAAIILLLTHPTLDADARRAIEGLEGRLATRAKLRYCAACALQRLWLTRISTDLGPFPPTASAYLDELGLPPLDRDFGRATLLAVCEREEDAFGYDAWAGYESLMGLFLAEIANPAWGARDAAAS